MLGRNLSSWLVFSCLPQRSRSSVHQRLPPQTCPNAPAYFCLVFSLVVNILLILLEFRFSGLCWSLVEQGLFGWWRSWFCTDASSDGLRRCCSCWSSRFSSVWGRLKSLSPFTVWLILVSSATNKPQKHCQPSAWPLFIVPTFLNTIYIENKLLGSHIFDINKPRERQEVSCVYGVLRLSTPSDCVWTFVCCDLAAQPQMGELVRAQRSHHTPDPYAKTCVSTRRWCVWPARSPRTNGPWEIPRKQNKFQFSHFFFDKKRCRASPPPPFVAETRARHQIVCKFWECCAMTFLFNRNRGFRDRSAPKILCYPMGAPSALWTSRTSKTCVFDERMVRVKFRGLESGGPRGIPNKLNNVPTSTAKNQNTPTRGPAGHTAVKGIARRWARTDGRRKASPASWLFRCVDDHLMEALASTWWHRPVDTAASTNGTQSQTKISSLFRQKIFS